VRVLFRVMAGDPNNEDDMFRVQATKEVCFMNRDLQERGFECLVEHHDIERVTSNEDRIHISCVVTLLEDDGISTKKHMRKHCSPSPCGCCLPCRFRVLGDTSDTC
jgi:hypothetical protein